MFCLSFSCQYITPKSEFQEICFSWKRPRMNEIMIDIIVFFIAVFWKIASNRITFTSGTWEVETGRSLMSS